MAALCVMSSEVETSLTSYAHWLERIRDSSTELVLSEVEGLGMTDRCRQSHAKSVTHLRWPAIQEQRYHRNWESRPA
jgi:hypothetical protein